MKDYKLMWRNRRVVAPLLVVLVLLAGCVVGGPALLTKDALMNAEYRGIYQESIDLADGVYEGEPFVEGGASRPTVTFIEPRAFGDLNGDDVDDAVALLVESSGGSGSFVYLAALLNVNGKPENVDTMLLGDRTQVKSLSIDDGQVSVKTLAHGPDDPMCCPTQETEQTYVLEGNRLAQTGWVNAGPGETDVADIVDIEWQWSWMFEAEPAAQSMVVDPENYTLVLLVDGTYRVKADCNQGSGAYVLEGSSLTLQPGPMTLAECEPESLYDEYLVFLGQVVSWELEEDELSLNLRDDAGTMGFSMRAESADTAAVTDIVDVEWQWSWMSEAEPAAQSVVVDPENYTLVLLVDGTVQIKADCNQVRGTYSVQKNVLTIEIGPSTRAYCGEQSLDQMYLVFLGKVRSYTVEEGQLMLHLNDDAGTMGFSRD